MRHKILVNLIKIFFLCSQLGVCDALSSHDTVWGLPWGLRNELFYVSNQMEWASGGIGDRRKRTDGGFRCVILKWLIIKFVRIMRSCLLDLSLCVRIYMILLSMLVQGKQCYVYSRVDNFFCIQYQLGYFICHTSVLIALKVWQQTIRNNTSNQCVGQYKLYKLEPETLQMKCRIRQNIS